MISTITYKGIQLDVIGVYHKSQPGPTYESQPIRESFEIEKMFYRESEITDLFEALGGNWAEIESIVLEQVGD